MQIFLYSLNKLEADLMTILKSLQQNEAIFLIGGLQMMNTVYRVISPLVMFAHLHLQTVWPRLEFARHSCV